MITNLLVIVFILLAVFWFSTQGLFSALLHLVSLLCAGTLALAAWEPLAIGYLIDRMPEYAWGVGLLAPFVIFLLLLRTAIDFAVPGNVDFPQLVNSIAGGAIGLVIGLLTAGFILIGVQFVGGCGLGGYEPWTTQAGKLTRNQHLWLGADDFADAVFTTLSGGAFSPFSGPPLSQTQPSLVQAAGAFRQSGREFARLSLRPANVSLTRKIDLDPKTLPADLRPKSNAGVIAVATQLNLAGSGNLAGAADNDGIFTAGPSQVMLLVHDADGQAQMISPFGYILNKDFGTLMLTGEYARTGSAAEADIDWLFEVPAGLTPKYLRIKQLRLPIPDTKPAPAQVDQWLAAVQWKPAVAPKTPTTSADGGMESGHGLGAGMEGAEIKVDDTLPVVLSDNWLNSRANNVRTEGQNIVSAEGQIQIDTGERVDRNLAINHISHGDNQAIVRIKMADARARSMYGKAMQLAGQFQAPMLVSDSGSRYYAIGYCRWNPAGMIYLKIDTTSLIQTMKEIDIDRLADGEELYLYFRVDRNIRLTQFKVGSAETQPVNLSVP
ncbi:MAG: CvpA family protein [Phycisphaeraceae bacterium]